MKYLPWLWRSICQSFVLVSKSLTVKTPLYQTAQCVCSVNSASQTHRILPTMTVFAYYAVCVEISRQTWHRLRCWVECSYAGQATFAKLQEYVWKPLFGDDQASIFRRAGLSPLVYIQFFGYSGSTCTRISM